MTRVLTLFIIIFASVVGNQANAAEQQKLDYSKLKPEHFSNLEHKMEFSDDEGNSYRVLNTDRNRCLEIQVTVGESKRWRKHGACYTFSGGKKTSITTYDTGVKQGLYERYDSKGRVERTVTYQNNLKEGYEEYYQRGKLRTKTPYVNGLKQGKEVSYDDGKVQFERDYVDDRLHGKVVQYRTSTGEIVAVTPWTDGKSGKTQWYK